VLNDFYLFPELKNWLGVQSLQTNQEFQNNVQAHVTSLAAIFFDEGIEELFHQFEKCLNLHSNYVENQS
jgi:hypothetical protein